MVKALNSAEGIKHFLATVPAKIEQVLDRPPVSDLIRGGAKKESIEACLSVQITKAASMLSVGGNLREGQALEIAIGLIADYPNESLEDFCLCLRRGIKGLYGDIFRFDVLVINGWMKAYLDEKYQVTEDQLMKEKEAYKDQFIWTGQAQTLTDEVKRQQAKDRLREWREAVENSKVESQPQHKETVRRGTGYKDPHTPEWYARRDRIRRAASEFYKDRHSYSKMEIYTVGEFEVFAESSEDAEKIFKQATQ